MSVTLTHLNMHAWIFVPTVPHELHLRRLRRPLPEKVPILVAHEHVRHPALGVLELVGSGSAQSCL